MRRLEPRLIPFVDSFGDWARSLLEPRGMSTEEPWLILFDANGALKAALAGDDARLFSWGKAQFPDLAPSPHIFFDPYDMPEWFYFSWYDLDIYALLVQHGVIDASEWEPGDLPHSWGSKF